MNTSSHTTTESERTESETILEPNSDIIDKNNNNNSNKNQQSLLIVGGGHVGLSFALLLAHQGIASTIIEKNKYPTINPDDDPDRHQYLDSRNTALSRRTVQIYQQIGLWDQLVSHACRIDEVHISELGSFGKAKLIKEKEGVESFGHVMENAWLGRKLLLAVNDSPLITMIDNTQVTELTQDESKVTVTIKTSNTGDDTDADDTHRNLTADLLVACDGRDSVIRQILEISTCSYDYQQSGIVGVVTTDQPHNHVGVECFSPAGPLALLPLANVSINDKKSSENDVENNGSKQQRNDAYRRSVVWICPKGEEQRYLEDDDYFLQTLQQTFGESAGNFLQAGKRGAYPLTKILAEKQVQGRCVIMGNSAHTLHPVAGQGFNLCMRDADTLSKMLAGQIVRDKDIGSTQLLKFYEQARKKDQKRVIRFCDAVVLGFTHPSPTVKFFRNLGLVIFDKVPSIKPLVATYAMGLKS